MRIVMNKYFLSLIVLLIFSSCEKATDSNDENDPLRIISPSQGSVWEAGKAFLIRWVNETGKPVSIDLYRSDSLITQLGVFAHIMNEFEYQVPASFIPSENYTLSIYVCDKPEMQAVSGEFRINETANLTPSCSITDPRDGKYILKGETVYVSIEADDPDGEVSSIKIYIDGEFEGQVQKSSYVFPWGTSNTEKGLHTIEACAIDNDNAESPVSKVVVVIRDEMSPVELVAVPGGNFNMGSYNGDYDEMPVVQVYITRDFYMGKYEVTNRQYADILTYALSQGELTGDYQNNITVRNLKGVSQELIDIDDSDCEISYNGTVFVPDNGKENRPAVEMTWWGAAFFCNMLSRQLNVNELYELDTWKCNFENTGFRLPTEAEWEYAAKYNSERSYPWGDSAPNLTKCNHANNFLHTTDAGSFSPQGDSQLGICDMAGNAWEWCNDWYNYYPTTYPMLTDPTGYDAGYLKVLRGGNIHSSDYNIRTTYRNCYSMGSGVFHGARVVLSIR